MCLFLSIYWSVYSRLHTLLLTMDEEIPPGAHSLEYGCDLKSPWMDLGGTYELECSILYMCIFFWGEVVLITCLERPTTLERCRIHVWKSPFWDIFLLALFLAPGTVHLPSISSESLNASSPLFKVNSSSYCQPLCTTPLSHCKIFSLSSQIQFGLSKCLWQIGSLKDNYDNISCLTCSSRAVLSNRTFCNDGNIWSPHIAIEHLKCGLCDWGTAFLILVLII